MVISFRLVSINLSVSSFLGTTLFLPPLGYFYLVAGHGAAEAGHGDALIIAQNGLRVCSFEHKQGHAVNGSKAGAHAVVALGVEEASKAQSHK